MNGLPPLVRPDAIHIEIDIAVPELPIYADIVRRWMTDGPAALAASQMRDALATPTTTKSLSRHLGGFGEPGTPWGSVVFAPYSRPRARGASLYAFSQVTYDKFLKRLGVEIPERAELMFSRLNDYGTPGAGDFIKFFAHLDGRELGEPPNVLRLIAHHPLKKPATEVPDETANQWADFAASFLTDLGVHVLYGHVANDVYDSGGGTAFESQTPRVMTLDALGSDRLRGYSWITMITATQAQRLGGVEALRTSGAFSSVTESDVAVLLRATERLSGYTDEAVERVWAAVAPLLPHGGAPRPLPRMSDGPRPRLVMRDAAEA
jgi:hypothetical protein